MIYLGENLNLLTTNKHSKAQFLILLETHIAENDEGKRR